MILMIVAYPFQLNEYQDLWGSKEVKAPKNGQKWTKILAILILVHPGTPKDILKSYFLCSKS